MCTSPRASTFLSLEISPEPAGAAGHSRGGPLGPGAHTPACNLGTGHRYRSTDWMSTAGGARHGADDPFEIMYIYEADAHAHFTSILDILQR